MNSLSLEDYGFTPERAEAFKQHEEVGLKPGRVIEEHRGFYTVVHEAGEEKAELSGRFRNEGKAFPAVGDWVALRIAEPILVEEVLSRSSRIARDEAGRKTGEQVIGANIDTAFLVMAADAKFNPNAIERYLTMLWESGAQPVLLFTKADACEEMDEILSAAETTAVGVPIHAISSLDGSGIGALDAYLMPGQTICLLGASGAGKSTLLNKLAGEEIAATQEVRAADGKGRHTTTTRQLHKLPSGALVVDTPGMRELQLWDATGLEDAFTDIEELAAECKFGNCTHNGNAGCAVEGAIDERRLESWRKLQRESKFQSQKKDTAAQRAEAKKFKKMVDEVVQHKRENE